MSIRSTVITGAATALLSGLLIWQVQGWRYENSIAQLEKQHAQELSERMTAVAQAEAWARKVEHDLTKQMEIMDYEAQEKIAAVADAERRAADERVRDAAEEYAAKYRNAAERATATAERKAADTVISMYAQLLGELDELAKGYAAEADRRRIAGLACEASYDSFRSVR